MRFAMTVTFVMVAVVACKQERERRAAGTPEDLAGERAAEPGETTPQARVTTTPPTRSDTRAPARPEVPITKTMIVDLDKVTWQDGPAALPKGVKIAVLEGAPPFPANQTFTMLARMPKNYTIPPHTHLVTERVTVLKGMVSFGHGDKLDRGSANKVAAGGAILIPPGHVHYAFTTDQEATIALTGVGPWEILYVNPKDDPRPTPATRPAGFTPPPWEASVEAKIVRPQDVEFTAPLPRGMPAGAKLAVLEGDPSQAKTFMLRLRLDKGQQIPVHAHSYSERFFVVSGKASFATGDAFETDKLQPLAVGSVGVVPANHNHYARAEADNTVIQIFGVGPFDMKLAESPPSQ